MGPQIVFLTFNGGFGIITIEDRILKIIGFLNLRIRSFCNAIFHGKISTCAFRSCKFEVLLKLARIGKKFTEYTGNLLYWKNKVYYLFEKR